MERILNDRLQWFFESMGMIPRNFFRFRRNKSCYDCLSIIRSDISLAKLRNEYLGILSLDLQSAYDNVNLKTLIEILREKNIPSKLLKFIFNLINNRTLFGSFGGIDIGKRVTNKGLPQGSILSPILFNIYISNIIYKIKYNCKIITFADDLLVYCSNSVTDVIIDSLSESALNINNWIISLNLSISFEKSKFIMFSKNSKAVASESYNIE